MRCFVAIELDPALRRPLAALLHHVAAFPPTGRRSVRWCNQQQLHLTLKFLGELRTEQLPGVCKALADAADSVGPFPLRLAGLGCFPSPQRPRVLWCGVEDPTDGCRRWLALADPLLTELGFPPESRQFQPHVTLGRSKSAEGGAILRREFETCEPFPAPEMTVTELVLFESRLAPTGARYTPLARAALRGPARPQ